MDGAAFPAGGAPGFGAFLWLDGGGAPSPAGSVHTGPEQGRGSLRPCSQVLLRNWAGGRARGLCPGARKQEGSGGAEAQEWEGPSQVSRGVSGSFSPWSMALSALPHQG